MISAASISYYLEGLEFPATKEQIIEFAEDRNAPPYILDSLYAMPDPPDRLFYSIAGVCDTVCI